MSPSPQVWRCSRSITIDKTWA